MAESMVEVLISIKMVTFIKVNGLMIIKKDLEFFTSLKLVIDMKDFGRRVKGMVKVPIFMQLARNIKEIG